MEDYLFEQIAKYIPPKIQVKKQQEIKLPPLTFEHVKKTDKLLITREVARYLNVNERTVNNYKLKKISCIELTEKKIYFKELDLLEFVNKRYRPALIVGEEPIKYPLTIKDKLLSVGDVIDCFEKKISPSTIAKYREERRLGYISLSKYSNRYPERDVLLFLNRNYHTKLTYND